MYNLFYKLLVKATHLDTFFMKNNITELHHRELKQSEVEPKPLSQKISEIRNNIPLLSKTAWDSFHCYIDKNQILISIQIQMN